MTSRWQDAARLARRTGFGATGAEVDAIVRDGAQHHVASVLAADPTADPGAKATPLPSLPALARPKGAKAGSAERKDYQQHDREQLMQLEAWWLRRMATVQEPFGEKLTFCWHNHFATSAQKVKSAAAMAAQNDKLRTLGRGDFRTLGYAMLTDAAMLRWLDGQKNTAKAPNENLAREFMELFSLGHGDGYTENDVRQGARALTGWVVRPDGSATLVAKRHDSGSKTFLGTTGDLDTAGYLDAILAVPGGPKYLATRWWHQLASDSAPSAVLIDRIAAAYGPKRDLRAMFSALLLSPEFTAAQGTIVVSPVEWLIGAVRALSVPLATDTQAKVAVATLRQLGELPFYPPSVGGWPSGRAWLSTAAAQIRARTALRFARLGDLSGLGGSTPSRLDAAAHLLGIATWSDRSAAVLRPHASNPEELIAVALNTPEYLTN